MNGASEEEMNAVLAKATAGDLSQKELDDIVAKAMTSRQLFDERLSKIPLSNDIPISLRNLSKAEKERLRAVRESAASGGLKVGGVTTDSVKQMMLLQVQCPTANMGKRLRDSVLFLSISRNL